MSKIYLTPQQKEWLKEAARKAIAKKRAATRPLSSNLNEVF